MTSRWLRVTVGSLLVCFLGGVLAQTAPVRADAPPPLEQQLLRSAQRWSNKNRTDLARHYVAKVLAIDPQAPFGLAYMGELALRDGKLDEAHKLLEKLQTEHPGDPATRDMQALYRVYTTDKEKLARMRLILTPSRQRRRPWQRQRHLLRRWWKIWRRRLCIRP